MELRFASSVVFVLAAGIARAEDCNANGAVDVVDISGGVSADCNRNGIPDDCELGPGLPFGYYEAGGFWDVEATEIHTLDIDGDGDLDLAVPTPRGIEILENSSGVLARLQHLDPPDSDRWTASLADADLDGDGDLDLIAAYRLYPPTGALFVLRNQGDGEFEAPAFLHAAEEPRFVIASELDGDGAPDLLTNKYREGFLVVRGGGGEVTIIVPGLVFLSSAATGITTAMETTTSSSAVRSKKSGGSSRCRTSARARSGSR